MGWWCSRHEISIFSVTHLEHYCKAHLLLTLNRVYVKGYDKAKQRKSKAKQSKVSKKKNKVKQSKGSKKVK